MRGLVSRQRCWLCRSASKLCDARLSLTINAVLLELYAASMQPIVEQRREAPARGDASTTRSTRYGPVVYYSILVEGRDFSVSSPAGPRATGSGNYCAGPTTAFLTAASVAAPAKPAVAVDA